MKNNLVISQTNKKTINSIEQNDNLDETLESDSLTEIYNIIKGELDLIGKFSYSNYFRN